MSESFDDAELAELLDEAQPMVPAALVVVRLRRVTATIRQLDPATPHEEFIDAICRSLDDLTETLQRLSVEALADPHKSEEDT